MTYKVEVDWERDGFDAGDDVTSLVRVESGMVAFDYGRDQSTALAPTVAGRGQFTLDNKDRRFTPRNTGSPLFGFVKPARPVRITHTISVADAYGNEYSDTYGAGDATYILFAGHTDDTPINPDVEAKTVSFTLVDHLADFRGLDISTELYAGIRTGEAIDIILDECGWTGGRDLDNGSTVMPYWWEDNADAFTAMETLVRCEGPPAMLTIGSDGSVVFKDRHHRLLDAASIASQGTWNIEGGAEPVMNVPFEYDEAWRNIINHGLIDVDIRQIGELQPIWTGGSYIKWSAGETKTFIVKTSDPFKDAVVPVSGTDYTFDAGSFSSVTLSRTSGASTTLTMTAGGSGARIRDLQLRARPVEVAYTQQVTASDSGSIAEFGKRSFPGDLPFCNIYDAQAVLETAIEMRADPLPILQIRFKLDNNTRAALLLPRDLSDRMTVVEPETALNDAIYIEHIAHQLTADFDHDIVFGCELVPPDGAVTAANVFIIGGSGTHDIGDGVLAR